MKKTPTSQDTEQWIKKIIHESIVETLQPREPVFERMLETTYKRISEYELKGIISIVIQDTIFNLRPELEDIIFQKIMSVPQVYEILNTPQASLAMVIAQGDPNPGVDLLKKRMANAKELIICDPYFFFYDPIHKSENEYVKEITSILPNKKLNDLTIYCKKPKSPSIIKNLKSQISPKVDCHVYAVNDIHDRVWIKDATRGLLVGTSFGGLGKKVTFIINLPKKDLVDFLELLDGLKSRNIPIS
jgi:hypothetical protein